MSYIGQGLPADTFQGFTTDSFTGDGSATTFTLSKEPFSEDTLIVVINNVIQKPTTNFTVSGTTLTIVGTAVASGDVIYAIHMGGPLPIGGAAELDLNGASDKLILDTDGDTTISADTDDQIDFKLGGTDFMSLTTTGATITTADNSDTLSLISTDADANSGPNLRLYRNSGSPAVGDNLGQIDFEGRNDNSQDVVYASMMARARDETDGTEDGGFQIDIMQGGTLRSLMKYYSDGADQELSFNDDSIDVDFRVEGSGNADAFVVDGGNSKVFINGTTTADVDSFGLCINQDAQDGNIISLKSSDVAHGMTTYAETDTWFNTRKLSSSQGGAYLRGWSEGEQAIQMTGFATTANTTKSTSGEGITAVTAYIKSGTSVADPGSDANLFVVNQGGNAKFIVDTEGQLHSDGGAQSAYDTYEDAQLVRAFDLSHGRGVIDSKFDKFISYNHEKLADMKLVGREEDGTPNHFINVTGMQRLHNGAIWQQYEKHQKLAEAVYEMAKEALGEDKADAILEKHDIKLLN